MGNSSEYIRIKADPNYPGKTRLGFVLEHRQVWWQNTGEDPTGYDIHHINGDKKDNRFENLEKLTRSEHLKKHRKPEMVTLNCDNCNNEFKRELRTYKSSIRNKGTKSHFCSRKCIGEYSHYNKKRGIENQYMDLQCAECGISFTRLRRYIQTKINKGQECFFCDRVCSGKFYRRKQSGVSDLVKEPDC